ncbi:MAG: MFS transporter, partial [Sphaerochaetaceae bacterium]|nr:MFS transporter [Sphaerochaetaceae bacterium]
IISVLLFGLFLSGTYPTTLATMPTAFNSSTVATGTCIALASLGAIIMPSIIGAIAQASGLVGAIGVICIALGAMLSLMTAKAIIEKRKAIEG